MAITNNEILLMVEVVSREKNLEKEIIFRTIETGLATAIRKKNAEEIEARVSIDRVTGAYEAFRVWEVVSDEELDLPEAQLTITEARKSDDEVEVGDLIEEPLEKVVFNRIAAQHAKQHIMQKIREAERELVADRYRERIGTLVSGTIKRLERGSAIVDLGDAEAILTKNAMIPREGLRAGDRIRALLERINEELSKGPQLILNRLSPQFLIELFRLEVPEVSEGIITIIGAARDPGSRAKISVRSNDRNVDPVGACVGIRGSRVQSVSNEIGGERVDIIVWSDDPAEFVIQALAPAEVDSIVIDEETKQMDVVVTEENLSRAIGRGGQNVRLASELTGWEINLMTDKDWQEKKDEELLRLMTFFMEHLDIDENVATILCQEDFTRLEEIAYVPKQVLLDIEEFDDTIVDELRRRAQDKLLTDEIINQEQNTPSEDLLEMEGMDDSTARELAIGGVRTKEDLAGCGVYEVLDIVNIPQERASTLIMTARAHWFE